MGSFIELNDTLRISKEQGFPEILDIKNDIKRPYSLSLVEGKIFTFKNKPAVRVYQMPPVRCFLVEDLDGKWIYWGLCHIVEITHDYINKTTSGKFKIIHLNNSEEVKKAFELIDRNSETN